MEKYCRLLCLCLIFLLLCMTGCTTEAPHLSVTEGTDAPSASTYAASDPVDTPPTVTDAYNETWTNSSGQSFSHAIPRLEGLPGDEVSALNEEIYRKFYTEKLNENGVPSGASTSYDWYITQGILTVIVTETYNAEGSECYTVYSVQTGTGHRLSREEVLEKAGVSEAAFEAMASLIMGNRFAAWLTDYIAEVPALNTLTDPFQKTVSEENAIEASPYFGRDGQLCFRGYIYQIAGGAYHEELLSTVGYETSEYYDALMKLLP